MTVEDVRGVMLIQVKDQTRRWKEQTPRHSKWALASTGGIIDISSRRSGVDRRPVSKQVHIGGVVQAQDIGVKFHLLNFHGQLFLDNLLFLMLMLMMIACISGAVSIESIFSTHQEVDGALVVLGRRAVGASLIM